MSNITLNIAASSIDAAQTAMDIIAQNLSNANTPGYETETANLNTAPGGDLLGTGDGVRVTSIGRPVDGLMETNAQQTQASLSQSSALQQVLSQAQLAFQEPSSTGLAADLSNFWSSWDTVASNPSDTSGTINDAQTLVTDLQQASATLNTTATDASNQLQTTVASANSMLTQLANLNGQISQAAAGGGNANALIDQRNQVMNQLSSAIGATGTTQPDGTLQVQVGGVTLVQSTWSDQLKLNNSSGTWSISTANTKVNLTTTSGTTAGLMASLNSYIPSYKSQLDNVANSLASVVNTQLAAGYTTSGTAGVPLFTGSGAGGLQVNPAVISNPSSLAVSNTSTMPDATNNGGNAQVLATLGGLPNSPDAAYQQLVFNVGNQVSSVNNQVQATTSVANAAQQNLQAVAGVNQNDQLVNLLTFQQQYQASAKVISTVDQAVQSLIGAVG